MGTRSKRSGGLCQWSTCLLMFLLPLRFRLLSLHMLFKTKKYENNISLGRTPTYTPEESEKILFSRQKKTVIFFGIYSVCFVILVY